MRTFICRIGRWVLLGSAAAILAGCQGYAFEELPSSIIKEKEVNLSISVAQNVDILFVVDDSGSMAGEQIQLASSFSKLTAVLDDKFGKDKYHIALVTTGMESPECPHHTDGCAGCMNQTGETGRFQDQRGCINGLNPPQHCVATPDPGTGDSVTFDWLPSDPTCRVVTSENLTCFYSASDFRGIVLQGTSGCGYERGLASMRAALQPNMLGAYNSGFLRDDATLAVIVVSDEDDCGEVGDINEDISGVKATACYYAADGKDPDGAQVDPKGKAYQLKPVEDYYNFLMDLKGNQDGMVKFAGIVGVKDLKDLSTTKNTYTKVTGVWQPDTVCTTGAPCTGSYCTGYAGERYIKLATMLGIGKNGLIDTICQNDFSTTMEKIGTFVACPREFKLSEAIRDPALANILVNGTSVPRYTCTRKDPKNTQEPLVECKGTTDTTSCPSGTKCVETWTYCAPLTCPVQATDGAVSCNPCAADPNAPGGEIGFAGQYDPCTLITQGTVDIELIYVTE